MDIAIKFGALQGEPLVKPDGQLNVDIGGQATLAARLLEMYPGSRVVGPEAMRGQGFEVTTLAGIDPETTLVVNLDVLDSVGVFQRLHRDAAEPKIMNFQWINPSTFHHPVNFAAMGLAYSFFPTFCAGKRVAAEVHEVVERWAAQSLASRARVAWADLGVETAKQVPRQQTEVPIVLYPAISMESRKQPQVFVHIVEQVQKQTPVQVVARLSNKHLVAEPAMKLAARRWATVGPLRSREDYWTELSRTTAFLATSREEAYGLEYVEAMLMGAIGIFPDLDWAHRLVPQHYPFLYADPSQAEAMLRRAVTNPDACRAELDQLVGGSFTDWVRENHARRNFEDIFSTAVREWFGA